MTQLMTHVVEQRQKFSKNRNSLDSLLNNNRDLSLNLNHVTLNPGQPNNSVSDVCEFYSCEADSPKIVTYEPQQVPLLERDLEHAVIFILSAITKNFHGEVRNTDAARATHLLAWRLKGIFSVVVFALVGLTFFESPLWCVKKGYPQACSDPQGNYPFFGVPVLPRPWPHVFELICLLVLWFKFGLNVISGGKQYFRISYQIVQTILLGVTALDSIYAWITNSEHFRLGEYLRILILIFHFKNMRKQMWLLARTLASLSRVIFITFLIIGFFAFVGTLLFNNLPQQAQYFVDFQTSIWSLFVLMTTSNYPDLSVRALDVSRLYFFYFLLFVILIVFFQTSLFTAIVYKMYQDKVDFESSDEKKKTRRALERAWSYLDPNQRGYLTYEEINRLAKEMLKYRQFRKYLDLKNIDLFFCALDVNDSGKIEEDGFYQIEYVLKLKFDQLDGPTFVHLWFPKFSRSRLYSFIQQTVQSQVFEYIVDVILIIMAVVTFIESWLLLQQKQTEERFVDQYSNFVMWHIVEALFVVLLVVEAFVRIVGMGWIRYWRGHAFDFFVLIASIMATFTLFIPLKLTEPHLENSDEGVITVIFKFFYYCQVIQIPGVLRLLRMIVTVSWFKVFYVTIISMVQPAKKLLLLLFCLMYIFSVLGMSLFGGLVKRDSEVLKQSEYGKNDYYAINMNDMMGSMTLMLEILVTNNFQIFADAYVIVSGTAWARLFFVVFIVIGDMMCLNLVLSTIIGIFMEEFGSQWNFTSSKGIQQVDSEQIHIQGSNVFFKAISSDLGYNGRFRATLRGHQEEEEGKREEVLRTIFKNKSGRNILEQMESRESLLEKLLIDAEQEQSL